MNARKIIEELIKKGARFTVYTDCAVGRGINGVSFTSYSMHTVEKDYSGSVTVEYDRHFEPMEDYLLIRQTTIFPAWQKKEPVRGNIYLDYDRITKIYESL